MELYQYIIIIAVLLIIAFSIVKMNKKNIRLEFNKLVDLLGGKDNILNTEVEMSRFKVTLKDITKANKEGILKLGAKGVVEIDDQLKIILGTDAKKLKKYIDELKWHFCHFFHNSTNFDKTKWYSINRGVFICQFLKIYLL